MKKITFYLVLWMLLVLQCFVCEGQIHPAPSGDLFQNTYPIAQQNMADKLSSESSSVIPANWFQETESTLLESIQNNMQQNLSSDSSSVIPCLSFFVIGVAMAIVRL